MFTCFWEICKFIFLLITWANRFFLLYFEIILVHKLLPFRPKKKTSQHSCFWQFVGKQQRWTHFVTDDCVWDSHIWICATRLQIFLPQIELKLKQTQKDVLEPSISCQNIKKKVYFPWENCSSQTVVHDILVLSRPREYWEKKQDNIALFYSLSYLTAHLTDYSFNHTNDSFKWWNNHLMVDKLHFKKTGFPGHLFQNVQPGFSWCTRNPCIKKAEAQRTMEQERNVIDFIEVEPKGRKASRQKESKNKVKDRSGFKLRAGRKSNFGGKQTKNMIHKKGPHLITKIHISKRSEALKVVGTEK